MGDHPLSPRCTDGELHQPRGAHPPCPPHRHTGPSQQQQQEKKKKNTRSSKQRRKQAPFKPTIERQQRSGFPRELQGWGVGGAGHKAVERGIGCPLPLLFQGQRRSVANSVCPWDALGQEGQGPGPSM